VVKLKACPYVHAGRRQGCSVVKLKACPQWVGSGEGKSVMPMARGASLAGILVHRHYA